MARIHEIRGAIASRVVVHHKPCSILCSLHTVCAGLPNMEQSLILFRGGDFDANQAMFFQDIKSQCTAKLSIFNGNNKFRMQCTIIRYTALSFKIVLEFRKSYYFIATLAVTHKVDQTIFWRELMAAEQHSGRARNYLIFNKISGVKFGQVAKFS